jgi:hypothetical protein
LGIYFLGEYPGFVDFMEFIDTSLLVFVERVVLDKALPLVSLFLAEGHQSCNIHVDEVFVLRQN